MISMEKLIHPEDLDLAKERYFPELEFIEAGFRNLPKEKYPSFRIYVRSDLEYKLAKAIEPENVQVSYIFLAGIDGNQYRTELKEINIDNLRATASIVHRGKIILEFDLYKDHYVVDWDSKQDQYDFFSILRKVGCPFDTPTIIQSKKKYDTKTKIRLGEVLDIEDEVLFFAIDAEDYGITWYKQRGRNQKIEFSSDKRNINMLTSLLTHTSENLDRTVWTDLDRILSDYKE